MGPRLWGDRNLCDIVSYLKDLRLCRPHTYTHTIVDVVFLEKLFWKAVYLVQCKYLFS